MNPQTASPISKSHLLVAAVAGGTVAALAFMAAGPASAVAPTDSWTETQLLDGKDISSPQQILTDGTRQLVPMSGLGQEAGSVAMYNEQGALLDSVNVEFQPLGIVKTAPNTYWVNNNTGRILELKRANDTLALTGKTMDLGHGYSSTLELADQGRIIATIDEEDVAVVASYDTTTGEVSRTKITDGCRPGNYSAYSADIFWISLGNPKGGPEKLVGINPKTTKIVKTFESGTATQGMVADSEGDLWIIDSAAESVTERDPATGEVKQLVRFTDIGDSHPLGITYNRALDRLAVSLPSALVDQSSVATINPKNGKIVSDTQLSGDYPSTLGFDSNNKIWAGNLRHREGQNEGGTISILTQN